MLKFQQRTIKVPANGNIADVIFSSIQGKVVGWAAVPSNVDVDADIVIKDGANSILEAIDVRIGSILKANNFINSVVPLSRENPGQLRAEIHVNKTIGEPYTVKTILFYVDDKDLSLKDCM